MHSSGLLGTAPSVAGLSKQTGPEGALVMQACTLRADMPVVASASRSPMRRAQSSAEANVPPRPPVLVSLSPVIYATTRPHDPARAGSLSTIQRSSLKTSRVGSGKCDSSVPSSRLLSRLKSSLPEGLASSKGFTSSSLSAPSVSAGGIHVTQSAEASACLQAAPQAPAHVCRRPIMKSIAQKSSVMHCEAATSDQGRRPALRPTRFLDVNMSPRTINLIWRACIVVVKGVGECRVIVIGIRIGADALRPCFLLRVEDLICFQSHAFTVSMLLVIAKRCDMWVQSIPHSSADFGVQPAFVIAKITCAWMRAPLDRMLYQQQATRVPASDRAARNIAVKLRCAPISASLASEASLPSSPSSCFFALAGCRSCEGCGTIRPWTFRLIIHP